MEQEKKQAVALMRYSAIAPLITGTQEDSGSLQILRAAQMDGSFHVCITFFVFNNYLTSNISSSRIR